MKYLTFLNSGCLNLCLNMLKSAENVGIDMNNFYIACLDAAVYEELDRRQYKNSYLFTDQQITDYQNWSFSGTSGFRQIVKYKWKVINDIYKIYPNLIWVDTDIVFKENPTEMLSNHPEILFQSDAPGSTLCSGFMVFNDTIHCKNLISDCYAYDSGDDQLIVNQIALNNYRDNISTLDEDLFPNGNVYYIQNRKENAIIVHNNWMIGVEVKENKFKEEQLWFL